jgi:hypothetical protein
LNLDNWDGIISLLIACIELLLLVNLLIFSENNKTNLLVYIIVGLLAGYQAFEFFICGLNFDSSFTTYLAFVNISFLPPLSLLLILGITGYKSKLKYFLFIPPLFFTVYYFFIIEKFTVVQCSVLYATYNYPLGDLYGLFYYSPILLSFLLLIKKKNSLSNNHFLNLLIAHLFIVVPVAVGFILLYMNLPVLAESMESFLCKFAFGYAVALSIFSLHNKEL